MAGKTGIIGYYNEHGYRVCNYINGNVEDDIYWGGNSKWDSTSGDMDPIGTCSLEELKIFCIEMTKNIAKEMNLEFLGVDYDESDDEEIE
jgi:hypothetical protein